MLHDIRNAARMREAGARGVRVVNPTAEQLRGVRVVNLTALIAGRPAGALTEVFECVVAMWKLGFAVTSIQPAERTVNAHRGTTTL